MNIRKFANILTMILLLTMLSSSVSQISGEQTLNSDYRSSMLDGSVTEVISGQSYYYSVSYWGSGRYDEFHISTTGASSIVATMNGATMESSDDLDLYYNFGSAVASCGTTSCSGYDQVSWTTGNDELIDVTNTFDGTHHFRVQRYSGYGTDYYNFKVEVISGGVPGDTTAPSVTITSPIDGSTVSDTIAVSADASDNVAVDRVEFRVDGLLKATDNTAPYLFNWDTTTATNDIHDIEAVAFDTSENSATSTISVTVDNVISNPGSCGETPRVTGSYPWWHDSIDAEKAHAAGCYGGDTVVVVLDTGLGSGYSSLYPAGSILSQYSHSYTKSLGLDNVDWNEDTEGHGSSVTGTILGYYVPSTWGFTNNYVMGIAPNADIVMMRVVFWVGGTVTYSSMIQNWAQAIYDAIALHNGDLAGRNMVISMSLGYSPSAASASDNTIMENAINAARAQGIVVSTSAGNDGPSADTTGNPANFDPSTSVAAAGWDGLTGSYGVAGIITDIPENDFSGLHIADFSSRGKVDITGIGEQLVLPSYDNNYYYISGTSFSCPQLSGVFAVLFGMYGDVGVDVIESYIFNSAYYAGVANTWGAGFVQVDGALGL